MKLIYRGVVMITVGIVLTACVAQQHSQKEHTKDKKKQMTYLALGDSYTIGEKVATGKRWPVQLIEKLDQAGFAFQNPEIIARTGWRTDELLAAMDKNLEDEKYDLVSVLIGVNNQYQGKPIATFKREFETILKRAIAHCKNGKKRVFVVGIPDYGVTPFGKKSGKSNIGKEIGSYNAICKHIAAEYEIPFYSITDISLHAKNEPDLIAPDGLHPSGEMYRRWVEKIAPKVVVQLRD